MGNQPPSITDRPPRYGDKASVKSALRTLTLFETFARYKHPLSLSELARTLDIPISSCHSLVGTLQSEGYLYSIGERRQYYPTRRLLQLTNAIFQHDSPLALLTPHLVWLRDTTGETVILGKREGSAITYLDVIEGPQDIRYTAKAGDRKPLHSSAIGKAMLGELEEEELAATVGRIGRPRITPKTLTDPDHLLRDIENARKRGYFITRGENVSDVWAIAKTVDIAGDVYGIAIAGPMHRIESRLATHAKSLFECCDRIEATIADASVREQSEAIG